MDCHLDWSTSKVEHGKLRVSLEPAPDFAFMMEFDGIVDPLDHPRHEGWVRFCWPTASSSSATCASSLLGSCARSSMKRFERPIGWPRRLGRANDSTSKPKAARAAKQESRQSAAAQAAAEHDARPTDAFRRSG